MPPNSFVCMQWCRRIIVYVVEATTDVSCLLQRHYTCSDSHDSVKHGGKARTACHFLPTRQYCIKLKTDGVNVVLAKATRQRRDLLYKSWTIEKKIAMCTTNTVKLEVQLFVTAELGRGGGGWYRWRGSKTCCSNLSRSTGMVRDLGQNLVISPMRNLH